MFNNHVLDMIELAVEEYISIEDFGVSLLPRSCTFSSVTLC